MKHHFLCILLPNNNAPYSLDTNLPFKLLLFEVINVVSGHKEYTLLLKTPHIDLNDRVGEDHRLCFEINELLILLSALNEKFVSRVELGLHTN